MQTISVGELKTRFSEILAQVVKGEEIIISYGKKHKKVAVLVPYDRFQDKGKRKLGLLKDRGNIVIHKDFKMTDEDLLLS